MLAGLPVVTPDSVAALGGAYGTAYFFFECQDRPSVKDRPTAQKWPVRGSKGVEIRKRPFFWRFGRMGGGPRPLRTTFFPQSDPRMAIFPAFFSSVDFSLNVVGREMPFRWRVALALPAWDCRPSGCLTGLPCVGTDSRLSVCDAFVWVQIRLDGMADGMEASTQQEMDKLTHLFLPLTLATKSQIYHCVQHQIHSIGILH